MNSQLSEVTKYMHETYTEFETAIEQYREMHPAAGMLEQELPMFGRYFAALSTSLEMLDKGIPGRKPNSFKIVRTALGKVHGKKPLHYHIRDIGRDYRLKLEGVEELLRSVPEVLAYAEGFIIQQPVIAQVPVIVKIIPTPQTENRQYAVSPEEIPEYPKTFSNLVQSNSSFFQALGETRQASRLKTVFEKVTDDLFNYSSPDGAAALIDFPRELVILSQEVPEVFTRFQSLENVDETVIKKLTDYGHALRNFIEQEKTELDREIESKLVAKRSRDRNPNQNF